MTKRHRDSPQYNLGNVKVSKCPCGNMVYINSGNYAPVKHCKICEGVRSKITACLRPSIPDSKERAKMRDKYYADWIAGKAIPLPAIPPRAELKVQKCAYCGNVSLGKYCSECINTGMANVHKIRGKTTGWDKLGVRKERIAVIGGARGNCFGGGRITQNSLDYFLPDVTR